MKYSLLQSFRNNLPSSHCVGRIFVYVGFFIALFVLEAGAQSEKTNVLFQVGEVDQSSAEFDGAEESFPGYIRRLGDRDKLFMVGHDDPKEKWTYILPGTAGAWAGMGYWSWRVNFASLGFTLDEVPQTDSTLTVQVAKISHNPGHIPTTRLEFNGHVVEQRIDEHKKPLELSFRIRKDWLRKGSNVVRLNIVDGEWLEFDAVTLATEDKSAKLSKPRHHVVQDVHFAGLEEKAEAGRTNDLVVDVINRSLEAAELFIFSDGEQVASHSFPHGRTAWEIPFPATAEEKIRNIQVKDKEGELFNAKLVQKPERLKRVTDEVDMLAGTVNSRWMINPGPAMPMPLVRYAPDNEPVRWKSGYDYQNKTISGFSHIHEWTMSGLSVMPHQGTMFTKSSTEEKPDEGWRSRIDPESAKAEVGKYSVTLEDTGIAAEISSTKRASFSRFTFPEKSTDPRIICALQTYADEYGTFVDEVKVEQVSAHEIRGYSKQRNKGSGYPEKQDYTVHFVIQFDQPIARMDRWADGVLETDVRDLDYERKDGMGDCGFAPVFELSNGRVVQARIGISLVDIKGAANNLNKELSSRFGWKLDEVVENQKLAWDRCLERFEVKSRDRTLRQRFYTCLFRSINGRGIIADYDGRWRDADEKIRVAPEGAEMFSSDAMWGTQWNLGPLWAWFYPEIAADFMLSQMAYFDAVGYTLKGPAGGEAIDVMLGSPELPVMAAAWTAGVRPVPKKKIWEMFHHQQTTPGKTPDFGGYLGNEHYEEYLKYGYIPVEAHGYAHYASSTLEYAYQDWATGELAKLLKVPKKEIEPFVQRAENWKHALHPEKKKVFFKNREGEWTDKSHCVEGSNTQLRWFVPHDVEGLRDYLGQDFAINTLNDEFEVSEALNFMAPADNMSFIKVNHGNQTMMHSSFLFNAFGRPDLSQKWVRSILDRYYGFTAYDAYLGDEDQGQMSAWLVLASIGIFSIDGGVGPESMVELIPPSFKSIEIKRPHGNTWRISATREVVESGTAKGVLVNGQEVDGFRIQLSELLRPDKSVEIEWR